jgi:hypothetical protein
MAYTKASLGSVEYEISSLSFGAVGRRVFCGAGGRTAITRPTARGGITRRSSTRRANIRGDCTGEHQ